MQIIGIRCLTHKKENLFNSVGYGLANVEELKKLGKFKIATYSTKNDKFVGKVIGTPKVQIVLPKELFNIKQVDNINKVSIVRKEESKPNVIKNALLHFDNDFNDIYTNKWSAPTGVTFTNDCKFGDGAVKFNNGMLQIQNRIDFKLEDFTIDFWTKCNPTQTAQYPTLISDESYGVRLEVAQLFTYSSYVPFDTIADDTWHHIALVRDNGSYYIYKDGQLIKSNDTSTNNLFSLKVLDVAIHHRQIVVWMVLLMNLWLDHMLFGEIILRRRRNLMILWVLHKQVVKLDSHLQ